MSTAAALSETKRRLLERMLRGEGAGGGRSVKVVPRPAGTVAPVSAEQRHVWLHASMAPDLPLYNEPITIHRKGTFDLPVLEQCFDEILRRHEIWRSSFELIDGEPVQIVRQDVRVRLKLVDLTALPPSEREAAALRIATDDARKPFDLAAAPLFRATVLKLAADEHRVHITLHHIIFDGVSIYRILLPELAALYEAFCNGRRPELAEPALQYADYAVWREQHIAGNSVERQMAYWRGQLAGELPVLQLPYDRPRTPTLRYRGAMQVFSIPAGLTDALKQLSRAEGATLYMVLLAAFKVLLHRYTGQQDMLVGGVSDMRRRPELGPMMGYFLNIIVLRTRPSADLTFREYLAQTRETVLHALDASDVPFARIVQELHPRRDLGSHPLFQILFSIEPPAAPFADGWDLTQMDVEIGAAKFDLYLELDERPEGLIGRFLYSTDLFDAGTILRMVGHWTTLLNAVAADPDCTLGSLPLLPDGEAKLLAQWNHTRHDYPKATLHECFAAQARRTPDAIALEFEGCSWTYQELDERASRLARRLRQAGVVERSVVAISVERSAEMVAGLLAILKAGAGYLPLDPKLHRHRMSMLLENAEPAALLTQSHLISALPASRAPIVLLEEPFRHDGGNPGEFRSAVGMEDLAYVLYTSGSTGEPKAVEVPHRAVVNLLTSMQRQPGFGAADSLLAVTTLSFDIATLELFLPLVSGGKVIVASRETAADPFRLAELIDRSGCTVMQATPATWRGLLEQGWCGNGGLKILCGGEVLSRELAEKLLACGASLWNMYGPTETTIWSTVHKVARGTGPVPIGRPIANTATYILDARGNPVPIGVVGDLYIGGAGLARGYRNAGALTRERFVASAAAPAQLLYSTGDLARYGPDGAIEWLGRSDGQVKIRGFRVGLEEVEAAAASHPAIAAAAVKAFPDAAGEMSLAAYVVARSDPAPDAVELRRFLRQRLPDYMVPSRYIAMPALPMTPNGKVDRKALPEALASIAPSDAVAPRSETERALAGLWKELLGVSQPGVHDNFFDLGGHSLLVARLSRRIETEFGQRPSMAALFNAANLGEMAALLVGPAVRTGSRSHEPVAASAIPTAPDIADHDIADRELMLMFESIGDDCEFGFVQRRAGAEPLGLLRFSGIEPDMLIEALQARFHGIADPANLRVEFDRDLDQHYIYDTRYRSSYLLFVRDDAMSREELRRREAVKLRVLRDMLIRNFENGARICVLKNSDGLREDQARRVFAALRGYGPATLMWVAVADAGHPPGTVEWAGAGLLRAWIDHLAPRSDPQASSAMWLPICRRARRLWLAEHATQPLSVPVQNAGRQG